MVVRDLAFEIEGHRDHTAVSTAYLGGRERAIVRRFFDALQQKGKGG